MVGVGSWLQMGFEARGHTMVGTHIKRSFGYVIRFIFHLLLTETYETVGAEHNCHSAPKSILFQSKPLRSWPIKKPGRKYMQHFFVTMQ